MIKKNSDYSLEVEESSNVRKVLTITIPARVVKEELKVVYKSLKSSVALPGFRKGAVPDNVLKARFGDQVKEDVTQRLVQSTYGPALQETGFAPLGAPDIDVKTPDVEPGGDFTYSATVEINPKIDIDGYKGMELKAESTEVSDKDVDEGLKRLCESRGEYKVVDRAVKEDDLVVIDFEASVDGKVLDKGRAKDFPVIIGKVTPLPGLDDAIKGSSKGDKVETSVKFPENYSEGSLAGKEAKIKVKVKEVKELGLPELDDEFAKDLNCEDLAELREKVSKDLKRIKGENDRERLKNVILTKLIDKQNIEVPESLEKKYLAMILNRAIENIRAGNPAPGDANLSIDQLKEKYLPLARRSVKEDVVLDSIVEKENITVTGKELQDAVRHLADARQVSSDELMSRIEREGALEVIKDGIKHERVFDLIFEHSKGAKQYAGKSSSKETEDASDAGADTVASAEKKAEPRAKTTKTAAKTSSKKE